MLKEKISKMKESLAKKGQDPNKKTIENLVVFVIILIVTVVMINYIWNGKEKNKTKNEISTKALANNANNKDEKEDDIENKLENILAKIKGVGDVKVVITYSRTSEVIPMYNEDSSKKTTQETDSSGGNRIVDETTTKKDIIYEESNGTKSPITKSIVSPTIEGAIITAKGAENAITKANIIQAVEAATGLATHKIQVFEMN